MKFKLLAIAAVMAASGAANAAIDMGSTGNGNLFMTAWDANSSYTLNTGYTIDSFQAAVTAGTLNYSFTDALLTGWLSTASNARFSLAAGDYLGAQRLITSVDGTPVGLITRQTTRSQILKNSLFVDNNLNLNGGPFSGSAVDAVSLASTAAYTGSSGLAGTLGGSQDYVMGSSFENNALVSNSLSLMRIDSATNTAVPAVYTPYTIAGNAVSAKFVGNTFSIGAVTAVPEPESFAMLLAGLGMIGSIVARRRRAA